MAKNSNVQTRIISCFNDILEKYLEIIKSGDQDPKQLCFYILPGLFGFLRGFGRIKNGFQTYYPMEIGPRRLEGESKRHEISQVGFIPSDSNPLESFNVPEETFGLLADIFSFFHSEELDSTNSQLFNFIKSRRDSSVYQTFSDYGVIYSGSLYAALYSLDSGSGKASHDQFRKQAKDSFKTYLEQIAIFRKNLETKKSKDSDDNQLDISELQRKINCITCCIKVSITMLKDESHAEDLLTKICDRLMASDSTSLFILMKNLLLTLLDGISSIGTSIPSQFLLCIDLIKRFLLVPAPSLVKLKKFRNANNEADESHYLDIKSKAMSSFVTLIKSYDDANQSEVQIANLKNRAVTIAGGENGDLAKNHLFELMTEVLRVSKSESTHLTVFTTLHTSLDGKLKSQILDQMANVALHCAETVPSDSSTVPNITSEIFELIAREFVDSKDAHSAASPLVKLAENLNKSHLEWLLNRLLLLFAEIASLPKSKTNKIYQQKACEIIPMIATACIRFDKTVQKATIKPLFREFWFYCTICGFNDHTLGHRRNITDNIAIIALYSPVLTFDENEPMKQTLKTSQAIKAQSVGSKEVESTRQGLFVALGSKDELQRYIGPLDYAYLIYHLTVLRLEKLRLNAFLNTKSCDGKSREYDYNPLFDYIDNQMIQKDKLVRERVLLEIVQTINVDFLNLQKARRRYTEIDAVLYKHIQLMLVKFNSTNGTSRRLADLNLTGTFQLFAHMMWHPGVITTELDIVQKLSKTLEVNDSFADTPVLKISSYSLKVPDCADTRQKMTQDFMNRVSEFLRTALLTSPSLTRSHLQEYLRQKESEHTILSAETQSVFDMVGLTAKDFAFNVRNKYAGEVAFLLKMFPSDKSLNDQIDRYKQLISETNPNIEEIEEQLFRLAGLLIIGKFSSEEKRRLIRIISWAIVDCFDLSVMETMIACWQWISSAKAEYDDLVSIEMVAAWKGTISNKLGIFADRLPQGDVLAFSETVPLRPRPPNVKPHLLWIKYLQETIETVKGTRTAFTRNIVSLIFSTFPSTIPGSESNLLSRDVTAAAARMELASLGLTLLYSDIDLGDVEKAVLRNKIYSNVFDYFSCPAKLPTQSHAQLREDSLNLIKFYFKLSKETRYMSGLNHTLSSLHSDVMSETGSTLDRSADKASYVGSSRTKTTYPRNKGNHVQAKINDVYSKKRQIILRLLAAEIERFSIWFRPRTVVDGETDDGEGKKEEMKGKEEKDLRLKFKTMQEKRPIGTDKDWKTIAKAAWRISPFLACNLPSRLRQEPALIEELVRLVRQNPEPAHTIPEAIKLLVTKESVNNDGAELGYLLTWAVADPATALSFFSLMYKPNPFTAQYAVKCLRSFNADQILFYIPQLVQALRYDTIGYVYEYLLWASKQSPLLCHQLIWNMKTNKFRDEDGLEKDDEIGDKIVDLITQIENSLDDVAMKFYKREFDFANELTEISNRIKPKNKDNGDRKRACLEEIKTLKVPDLVYLPSNPGCVVTGINRKIGIPLQSAAKAPYLAEFKVKHIGVQKLEKACAEGDEEALAELEREISIPQKTIFKAGDDCRQDMLALQVIEIFRNAFQSVGLDVYLFPYKVVATSPGYGIIECIPDSKSRNEIGKETDQTLIQIFRSRWGRDDGEIFQEKRRNFIRSMAAYSLVLFILQIKDRHNGNIMIDNDGHLLHIDFGFIFESSPGGNLGWEPDMKITAEMVELMGGSENAKEFKWFHDLVIKSYLAVRPYQESIISLVSLMLGTGLPCFLGNTIKALRERFSPTMSEKQAAGYMREVIRKSFLSKWSHTYDMIQKKQQGINYA